MNCNKIDTYVEVKLLMSENGDLLVKYGNELYPLMANDGTRVSAFVNPKKEIR